MLQTLIKMENTRVLSKLLRTPDALNSLDIDYHPPRVERLFGQVDEYRVYFHIIHPCRREDALYHPHPWPSAMHVLKGTYEMGITHSAEDVSPSQLTTLATVQMQGGGYYEMTDPNAWHYVRPLEGPCMSVMITGAPWGKWQEKKATKELKPLSAKRAAEIRMAFLDFYL